MPGMLLLMAFQKKRKRKQQSKILNALNPHTYVEHEDEDLDQFPH
jgi:hypothetical protein